MKKFLLITLAVFLVSMVILSGCAQPAPAPAPTPAPAPKPAPAPTPAPAPAPAPAPKPTPTQAPTATSPPSSQKPIELKALTFLPADDPTFIPVVDWYRKVGQQTNGELTIKYLGGPEVIASFEQIDAISAGVIDMSIVAVSYQLGKMPEVRTLALARGIKPWELRESGALDYLSKIAEKKLNVHYLGIAAPGNVFTFYSKNKVQKPEDFKGQKFMVSLVAMPYYTAWGLTGISIPPPDIYTSLERGLVQGCSWGGTGAYLNHWYEVLKYIIMPRTDMYSGCPIAINLNTWNRIPQHLQKKLEDSIAAAEREWYQYNIDALNKELQQLLGKGIEVAQFSPEDSKRFNDAAFEIAWNQQVKKEVLDPTVVANLEKLFRR